MRRSDPNQARKQRGAELSALRREAEELTAYLAALESLRARGDQQASSSANLSEEGEADEGRRVWEEICRDQQKMRLTAERENESLRRMVDEQAKTVTGLRRSLGKLAYNMSAKSQRVDSQSIRMYSRVYDLPFDLDADAEVFDIIIDEVDGLHAQIDQILELNGLSNVNADATSGAHIHDSEHGRYLDIFLRGFLPFDSGAASDVIWRFFSGSAKHLGPLYFKSSKALDSSTDTVIEKYAIELFANYKRADFRYRQVMRRYVEANRVIVAWVGFVEPVELANKSFTRCGYRTYGVIVCEPMQIPDTQPYTCLRRCQRFTPYLTGKTDEVTMERAKEDFGAIMEFMLSLDSANVHLQQFQDELLRQSLPTAKTNPSGMKLNPKSFGLSSSSDFY